MSEKGIRGRKLSKTAIIICVVAVLFAAISIQSANSMRITAESMYKHPYTVANTARSMRSRLLDMKRFVSIFLTKNFEDEDNARKLFEEYYDMQEEGMDTIYKHYAGPRENADILQKAMDDLAVVQEEAVKFAVNIKRKRRWHI